jgi:site-specific DNA-methyltransferase (adenine-specific)
MTLDVIKNMLAEEFLKSLEAESVHCIISDIPYGIGAEDWDVLHNNTNSAYMGTSPAQQKAGRIFKSRGKPLNGWSEADRQIPYEYYKWCSVWTPLCFNVLKPGASAIIFAGRRLAHRCICAMEDAGFTLKDILAWIRPRAPHRAQRMSLVFQRRGDESMAKEWDGWRLGNLRPVFEPVLWFTKPYAIGTTVADNARVHGVGGYNQDAFLLYAQEPDNILEFGFAPGESGLHPTQKPVRLIQALVELTTKPGQLVVDPFCGSGSTLVAARNTGRHYLGCDENAEYCRIAEGRLTDRLPPLHKRQAKKRDFGNQNDPFLFP